MTQVRIREVVGTLQAVDSESLLSPQIMERIVAAVLQATRGAQRDEAARQRDTRIGAACCHGGDEHGGKP
ncbi:putative N-acetylmannosamine-6-phosphate epimerase [Duganella sp. 1411]|jgi:putative N-acetylmannosamine-6-phosphate epimerase|uniref:hypothetical protein n=1 Tax=Duganella sp. 1411 TaxID=2806572 RepID=UPI001AE5041C|nr:hypothetical protein [Duganella sp. 1411]MBP1202418.1 putative N-acetylmannosamine-6-phosphate epimerase [Duganella sp. 1411]